ncbi:MAG: hypothetical protein C4541_02555 [Candidatus Auribacter fodinae]|jgi:flagellar FliL protein|uniref:Flagellar protein FliL n=1 Tax=Candidatus Auribacter fodinae TaxID=2093366 RepID=A0A3A4R8B4_9BACT|nr:MAG: hypothetical protein C4541_02555 [Candidatus Auribacter fodinae]
MPEENDVTQAQPKKKSSLKLVLIGLIVMILVPVIGFGIAAKVLMSDSEKKTDSLEDNEMGEVYPLETIVVNIANTHGTRYLRAGITFEVSGKEVIKELDKRNSQVTDILIMILSNKELNDLIDTAGKNQIRREILDKVNAKLTDGKLKNIYFTEFVIQ